MTAKEQLRRAIDDLSEAEAADVLELISRSRDVDAETATEVLDGIDGAYERAQLGVEQARAGQTTSLDDLERGSR
jgi:hypothetical protein